MKNLLIILVLAAAVKTYGAEPEKAPAPLTNSEIERKLENGVVQKFDGDEWMIVKRTKPKKKAVVPVPAPIIKEVIKEVEIVKEIPPRKNRVSLLAGRGPQEGLDRSSNGPVTTVESRVGAIGGLQYQRLLNDKLSVGAQIQTNKSLLLGIGLDF